MAKKKPPATGKIVTIREALERAGERPVDGASVAKKNYAERFSRNIATVVANALRPRFPSILPSETGEQQESLARTAKGMKKLDVNFSTPQLGLALGVSIKSINFADPKTGRYTKNYSRNDNELRAEATDYHQRQPYAVLVGVLFLPLESCDDANAAHDDRTSSFGAAVKFFRSRANRRDPRDDIDLFERFFVALYRTDDGFFGDTHFFDVMNAPPKARRPNPAEVMTFDELIRQIGDTYNRRNDPPFSWAE